MSQQKTVKVYFVNGWVIYGAPVTTKSRVRFLNDFITLG